MTLIETDEMCETHFMDPVPKQTCSICMRSKRISNTLAPERVIVPANRLPQKQMYMWDPYQCPLNSIPVDRDFVHITRTFSSAQFDLLTEHLPELVLVEIIPSFAWMVEANLIWYSSFHVGITARRRYRQV